MSAAKDIAVLPRTFRFYVRALAFSSAVCIRIKAQLQAFHSIIFIIFVVSAHILLSCIIDELLTAMTVTTSEKYAHFSSAL